MEKARLVGTISRHANLQASLGRKILRSVQKLRILLRFAEGRDVVWRLARRAIAQTSPMVAKLGFLNIDM